MRVPFVNLLLPLHLLINRKKIIEGITKADVRNESKALSL
ncbi:hypothetical protein SAMN05421578_10630 [Paenibacillus macquariensis]|uniref:Uncharacterized protein n=1 Tax=Paenibacillus macquariensis TaxID=948756 RepID=A0ABY1JZ27_9BACL|nr:hypothetical protein SAMN05421578_10630 [Paenibacillus macquariensis]